MATDRQQHQEQEKHEKTVDEKQEDDGGCTSIESTNSCGSDDSFETFVMIEKKDDRTENAAAFSPDVCFRRIDTNIRYTLKSMLKRKHLPLARIMWFEDDIIPFFNDHNDSVYVRDLNNGFDRMLLHAVAQYLNLISKSFTRDGERYTQVENRRLKFIPPKMLLSEYIKSIICGTEGG